MNRVLAFVILEVVMFPGTNDALSLKVTVDPTGLVWYLEGDHLPVCSKQRVEDFRGNGVLPRWSSIRVVARPENIFLLLKLFSVIDRSAVSLEVCSPACFHGLSCSDLSGQLLRMRCWNLAPSLGGWHVFGTADFPSYALYHLFTPDEKDPSRFRGSAATIRSTLRCHPAWTAWSFVEGLNQTYLASVVGAILDPRWFVDPLHDRDGTSQLCHFLGVDSKTITVASAGKGAGEREDRCSNLLYAWRTTTKSSRQPSYGPRQFLYRLQAHYGGARGELEATRHFVEFLRQTWLNVLCVGPQAGRLFVPEHFFHRPDEAEAYRKHIALSGHTT